MLTSSYTQRVATTALVLVLASALASCGSSSSSPPEPPPPPHEVTVSAVSGPTDARLACNRGAATTACDLRLYEVMTEAFVDGDPAANFDTGYGSSHHRGDLTGIIESLDYIKSLGVNALWITPIFRTTDNSSPTQLDATGYFISDYFSIDPHFGTLAQARTLVEQAHARGLYVFFDGVFGHHKSSVTVAPSPGGLSPVGPANPVTYPDSLPFYTEVATYWVKELKIDGWRLDQAYQVPPSAWATLRQAVANASQTVTYVNADGQTVHPLGYMVAEVWDGESRIASAAYGSNAAPALASAFDFPMRYRLLQTLATQERTDQAWATKQPATILEAGYENYAVYPDHAMPNLMLTNHDLVRFGDLIQRAGYPGPEDASYWARHRAAFAFMAAHSGPVTLYYGDEIGQEVPYFAAQVTGDCAPAGLCDDHVSRSSGIVQGVPTLANGSPTVLNPNQAALKDHVAELMALRASHPALSSGTRTHVFADETVYVDLKTAGADRVLFVLNVGRGVAKVTVDPSVVSGATTLTDLEDGSTVTAADGQLLVEVPALSGRLLAF